MAEFERKKYTTRLHETTNCFPLDCARLIEDHLDLILALPDQVLKDEDIEIVHEMRRGVNRLRVGWKHFPSPLGRKKSKQLARENQWLAGELGELRDLDVSLHLVETLASSMRKRMKAGYAWSRKMLLARRAPQFATLADALRTKRFAEYQELLRETKLACKAIIERRSKDKSRPPKDERVTTQLPPVFKHLNAKFSKKLAKVGESFNPEQLHKLRLSGKRIRYFTDFFRPYRPGLYQATNKQLKKLHDTVGAIHDIDVLRPMLEESFAQLSIAKPEHAREAWPGVSHLFRQLSARRLKLQERLFRYWRNLHSEPFTRRSRALAETWAYRKSRRK